MDAAVRGPSTQVASEQRTTLTHDTDVGTSSDAGQGLNLKRLDRYVLLRLIGKGAFGRVWQAYDPELDRRVAVKVV